MDRAETARWGAWTGAMMGLAAGAILPPVYGWAWGGMFIGAATAIAGAVVGATVATALGAVQDWLDRPAARADMRDISDRAGEPGTDGVGFADPTAPGGPRSFEMRWLDDRRGA